MVRGSSAELAKMRLDQVPGFIDMSIRVPTRASVRLRRNQTLLSTTPMGLSARLSASNALSAASIPPPARTKPMGLPGAATRARILVLNPPRGRPIASSFPSFFGRRHCADGRARWCCRSSRVHHRHRRRDGKGLPDSEFQPAPETRMDVRPVSEALWVVTSRT